MKLRQVLLMFFYILASFSVHASEMSAPWEEENTAIVLDPYSGNEINWDELKKDSRVVAIIHKATEGMRTDPRYAERKKEAEKRGYLWGSYHLGRPGDAEKQALNYLNIAAPGENELIALDLEALSEQFMTFENAKVFVATIVRKTGRYPLLYVNHTTAKSIAAKGKSADAFARCPLWYARFRSNIPDFPASTWKTYTLWQFSSELNCEKTGKCLYNVPGVKFDMDLNIFYGTPENLRGRWPLTGKLPKESAAETNRGDAP